MEWQAQAFSQKQSPAVPGFVSTIFLVRTHWAYTLPEQEPSGPAAYWFASHDLRILRIHQHGMPLQYWVATQWGIFALTPQSSTNTLTLSYSGISCSPCSYPARGLGVAAGADLGMPATKCSAKFLAGQAAWFLTSASACAFATSKPTVANRI